MKDMSVLRESPFIDHGSIVGVFADISVWLGIKRIIDQINENAAAYSFADLQEQMRCYLRRSNGIPMAVLGWKSPNQKHKELEIICA